MKEELENLFLTRRSIRKYEDKQIELKALEELIRIGMSAPSAGNQQPWEFIIIDDREKLDKIPDIHPYSEMIKDAPAAILICGTPQTCKYKDYWVQDCSAATQNILLAINALGLGGVWLGIYPLEERITGMRNLLDIPESITPFALISLGYPNEELKYIDRFDSKRIHKNNW